MGADVLVPSMRLAAFCHVACSESTVIPLGCKSQRQMLSCRMERLRPRPIARCGVIVWAVDALRARWLVCSPRRPGARIGRA